MILKSFAYSEPSHSGQCDGMSANNQSLIGEVPSISIPVLVCVCAEVSLRVLIKVMLLK